MPDSTFQITGTFREIDGQTVLLCDQLPGISGVGQNNDEALYSLASSLRACIQHFKGLPEEMSQRFIVPQST